MEEITQNVTYIVDKDGTREVGGRRYNEKKRRRRGETVDYYSYFPDGGGSISMTVFMKAAATRAACGCHSRFFEPSR